MSLLDEYSQAKDSNEIVSVQERLISQYFSSNAGPGVHIAESEEESCDEQADDDPVEQGEEEEEEEDDAAIVMAYVKRKYQEEQDEKQEVNSHTWNHQAFTFELLYYLHSIILCNLDLAPIHFSFLPPNLPIYQRLTFRVYISYF